jgi:hypothetical protein
MAGYGFGKTVYAKSKILTPHDITVTIFCGMLMIKVNLRIHSSHMQRTSMT